MKLTKEKAIEEHRKMWNWIADELEKPEILITKETVHDLKVRYCNANNWNLRNGCFCCEYDEQFADDRCMNCPILWGTEDMVDDYYCECNTHEDIDGLWWESNNLAKDGEYEGASVIARQIANLPEREE